MHHTALSIQDRLDAQARAASSRSGKSKEQEFVRLLDDPAVRAALGAERQVAALPPRAGLVVLDADGLAVCRAILAGELAEVRRREPRLTPAAALAKALAGVPADVRVIFDGPEAA